MLAGVARGRSVVPIGGAGTVVSWGSKTKTRTSVMCEQQQMHESGDGRSWLLF